jgi:deoxyadenosine/deoxycytidine kinase
MKELEFMSESEHEIFKALYKSFEHMSPINNVKVIYLRCDPQICHQRIAQRKRPEESEISIEYLQMLHDKHEKWIESYEPSQVLILDATNDFCSNDELLNAMV